MIYYVLGLICLVIYVSMLWALHREWTQQNPYWDRRRWIHFVKTYWHWPALFMYIVVMVPWELWRTRKDN